MTLSYAIFLAFTFFGTVRVFAYMPQIWRISRDQNGAAVISYCTWWLWTASNATTAAYAGVNLNDPTLMWVNLTNTACCLVVLGLTAYKRHQFYSRTHHARPLIEMPWPAALTTVR